MKKNSNHKITYEERCDLAELRSQLRLIAQSADFQFDILGEILPKNKWSAEKWESFQKAKAFVKNFKKGNS